MSEIAVEGKIMRIEVSRDGQSNDWWEVSRDGQSNDWWLYHLWGNSRVLAFGYDTGANVGDTISSPARPGIAWNFATTKKPVITRKDQPIYKVDESIFKNAKGKSATLAMPIVMWFSQGNSTWTADDSYEDIRKLAPNNSPNICSLPVRYLIKLGYIHWNGTLRKSLRENAHSRDLRVYERTRIK